MAVSSTLGYERDNAGSGLAAAEGVGGIVAIVLTILGLAHVAPLMLVAIACIAIGVAFVASGAVTANQYMQVLAARVEISAAIGNVGGWSVRLLTGVAGIVLGILALLRLDPVVLVAIATIGYGGALLLFDAAPGVGTLAADHSDQERYVIASMMSSGATYRAASGLAAVVLGILALAGFASLILILIALLSLGAFTLLNGSATAGLLRGVFTGKPV